MCHGCPFSPFLSLSLSFSLLLSLLLFLALSCSLFLFDTLLALHPDLVFLPPTL
jgi:hypothetical protein